MKGPAVATSTPVEMCSKCGEKPRAYNDSSNPWCKDCLAKYQREYTDMMKRRTSEQAFNRGVAALRSYLVTEFERLASGTFSGYEIAELIANAPRPIQVVDPN